MNKQSTNKNPEKQQGSETDVVDFLEAGAAKENPVTFDLLGGVKVIYDSGCLVCNERVVTAIQVQVRNWIW